MRHSCQESHDHAKGHSACEENSWSLGWFGLRAVFEAWIACVASRIFALRGVFFFFLASSWDVALFGSVQRGVLSHRMDIFVWF